MNDFPYIRICPNCMESVTVTGKREDGVHVCRKPEKYVRCSECDADILIEKFKDSDLFYSEVPDGSDAFFTCSTCGNYVCSKIFTRRANVKSK